MPEGVDKTPVAYLRQLSAYREVMRAIYPERPVSCALLWTDIPELTTVPDALLDAYKP